ncbi:MAG: phosphatase PAP2 family protein [Streptosporangiaceae bacterium]
MRRYLLAALWPAGMAAIAAGTVVAARRAQAGPSRPPASAPPADGGLAAQNGSAAALGQQAAAHDVRAGVNGSQPGGDSWRGPGTATAATRILEHGAARRVLSSGIASKVAGGAAGTGVRKLAAGAGASTDWRTDLLRLGALSCASGVLSYGVMTLLGPAVMRYGPAVDEPMHDWVNDHQIRVWAAVMGRLNKVGNTWTTWGAAGTAAVCLGVTYPRKKWLPPAALGSAILVDHYATIALRRTFGRVGPPTSPLGTYPSGGTDRIIMFYGLIAHMLWRQFSGTDRGKVWTLGAMAALCFNQAYCREYLSKHWFTDILAGFLYGGVLLAPFMAAVNWIAGPPALAAGPADPGQPEAPAA